VPQGYAYSAYYIVQVNFWVAARKHSA
jgi:hypothetical protein